MVIKKKKIKILLLGSKSSLAKQLIKKLSNKVILKTTSRKNFDILVNFEKLKEIIKSFKPNIIINCIALTKFLDCEYDPAMAYKINFIFPLKLSIFIRLKRCFLIHFSTEAVFQDSLKKLPDENFKPNPLSIYGNSKYLADKAISKINNSLIVRLPTLVGPTQNHQIINKILKKINKNEKVYVSKDIYSTPIKTIDFSDFFLKEIILRNKFIKKKIIHICSKKRLSTYDIVKMITKNNKIKANIVPVREDFFKNEFIKPKKLGLKSIYKECTREFYYE